MGASVTGFFFDLGLVLSGEGVFASGVGAPTVEWRGDTQEYVMYFESPAASDQVPEGCASSFVLGRATSPDGVAWTVDASPALASAGSGADPRSCSVAQPAILFDGARWNLFYSASTQPFEEGAANTPSGIGWATSADGVAWTVEQEVLVPFTSASIGLPSAAALYGTIYLHYAEFPDVFQTSRVIAGGDWTPPVRVLDHAEVGRWSTYWVHGPSLVCDEDSDVPLSSLFGGDTEGTFVRSLGWATSVDGAAWATADESPLSGGTLDATQLNHWDVLRSGAGHALWYSRTDEATGKKAIGVAISDVRLGEPAPRACPNPWFPPDDTGAADTGADSGAGAEGGEDSADEGPPVGCGCASIPPAVSPFGVLLAGAWMARRRR